jgi:hypothetical protein
LKARSSECGRRYDQFTIAENSNTVGDFMTVRHFSVNSEQTKPSIVIANGDRAWQLSLGFDDRLQGLPSCLSLGRKRQQFARPPHDNADLGVRPLVPHALDVLGINRCIPDAEFRARVFAGSCAMRIATSTAAILHPVQWHNRHARFGVLQGEPSSVANWWPNLFAILRHRLPDLSTRATLLVVARFSFPLASRACHRLLRRPHRSIGYLPSE